MGYPFDLVAHNQSGWYVASANSSAIEYAQMSALGYARNPTFARLATAVVDAYRLLDPRQIPGRKRHEIGGGFERSFRDGFSEDCPTLAALESNPWGI
ncbi:MAG: hypothetical protein BWY17_02500 [Deltaproteobacteria bacterium ADurb.Bin207]|jgi:hypothetical protein|nr:MAG: hypothetical protein BWY17_02500 [Deltaproteobacteria bacterium ADurb.Bin207]